MTALPDACKNARRLIFLPRRFVRFDPTIKPRGLSACQHPFRQTMLLADRGYDVDWIRELARQQGAWANIPPKRNRKDPICFSPFLYRARNLIERFFNKIKQYRGVATRYDKLAANYLAFVKLALIRIWLRASESAS
jgi:transposase